ncbi:hypothetical protein KFE25_014015 [Diacronema lutheri]|uniref:Uncharacterized protein n=1 Tax=Diacronema lutheri TaxID=2081491 RepID=A0A8J5X6A0_DIALT|nr:hypothetical protein KFE25_014015 [Diacronema lutheri]
MVVERSAPKDFDRGASAGPPTGSPPADRRGFYDQRDFQIVLCDRRSSAEGKHGKAARPARNDARTAAEQDLFHFELVERADAYHDLGTAEEAAANARERAALFDAPEVQAALVMFWHAAGLAPDARMAKEEYVAIYARIACALGVVDDIASERVEGVARAHAHDDWLSDMREQDVARGMGVRTFMAGLFELADVWVEGCELEDYVTFLSRLFRRITRIQVDPDALARELKGIDVPRSLVNAWRARTPRTGGTSASDSGATFKSDRPGDKANDAAPDGAEQNAQRRRSSGELALALASVPRVLCAITAVRSDAHLRNTESAALAGDAPGAGGSGAARSGLHLLDALSAASANLRAFINRGDAASVTPRAKEGQRAADDGADGPSDKRWRASAAERRQSHARRKRPAATAAATGDDGTHGGKVKGGHAHTQRAPAAAPAAARVVSDAAVASSVGSGYGGGEGEGGNDDGEASGVDAFALLARLTQEMKAAMLAAHEADASASGSAAFGEGAENLMDAYALSALYEAMAKSEARAKLRRDTRAARRERRGAAATPADGAQHAGQSKGRTRASATSPSPGLALAGASARDGEVRSAVRARRRRTRRAAAGSGEGASSGDDVSRAADECSTATPSSGSDWSDDESDDESDEPSDERSDCSAEDLGMDADQSRGVRAQARAQARVEADEATAAELRRALSMLATVGVRPSRAARTRAQRALHGHEARTARVARRGRTQRTSATQASRQAADRPESASASSAATVKPTVTSVGAGVASATLESREPASLSTADASAALDAAGAVRQSPSLPPGAAPGKAWLGCMSPCTRADGMLMGFAVAPSLRTPSPSPPHSPATPPRRHTTARRSMGNAPSAKALGDPEPTLWTARVGVRNARRSIGSIAAPGGGGGGGAAPSLSVQLLALDDGGEYDALRLVREVGGAAISTSALIAAVRERQHRLEQAASTGPSGGATPAAMAAASRERAAALAGVTPRPSPGCSGADGGDGKAHAQQAVVGRRTALEPLQPPSALPSPQHTPRRSSPALARVSLGSPHRSPLPSPVSSGRFTSRFATRVSASDRRVSGAERASAASPGAGIPADALSWATAALFGRRVLPKIGQPVDAPDGLPLAADAARPRTSVGRSGVRMARPTPATGQVTPERQARFALAASAHELATSFGTQARKRLSTMGRDLS